MTDALTRALDERTRLTANYRRAKKAQYAAACEKHPDLLTFQREIRRFGIGQAAEMINFVREANNCWLRLQDRAVRALALEIVSTRIRQIRESAGLPPFDDPMPDKKPNAYQTIREILT
jgi:hypothetical protein